MNRLSSLTAFLHFTNKKDNIYLISAILVCWVIFGLDMILPLGIATGILYALPISFMYKTSDFRQTVAVALLAAILLIAGIYISPSSDQLWKANINRVLSLFLILLSTYSVIRYQVMSSPSVDLSSKEKRNYLYIVIIGVILFSFWVVGSLQKIKSTYHQEVVNQLTDTMEASRDTVKNVWIKNLIINTKKELEDPVFLENAAELVKTYHERNALLNSPAQQRLREYFKNYLETNELKGIFLISRDGMSLASMRDTNVGIENIIVKRFPDKFKKTFDGEIQIVPISASDVPIRNQYNQLTPKYPTMFLMFPVHNQEGKVIAAFTLRVDPNLKLKTIMNMHHFGKSGISYIVSKDGLIYTIGRSDLGINGKTIFKQEFKKLSFTHRAAEMDAHNLKGERVIRVWEWDNDVGMMFVSEILENEALAPIHMTKLYILGAILGIIAIGMGLFLSVNMYRRKIHLETEAQLREYNERLERLISERTSQLEEVHRLGKIGNWTWEIAANKVVWSAETYKIFGVNPEDGEPTYEVFLSVIHEDDREAVNKEVSSALEKPDVKYFIQHRVVVSGEIRYVEERGYAIRDANGEPIRMIGTVQDITEREEYEESLKIAKQNAENANRAKSIFLANMSHEIRTPMNAVLGYAQLMLRSNQINPEIKRYVEIIHRSGEHLLDLINDILDMSKIEAGGVTLNNGYIDLYALLEDIELMFQVRATEKSLRFQISWEPDLVQFINSDEQKIRQVLINLIGNALKFTDHGAVSILVSHEKMESADGEIILKFEVNDSGIPIAQHDHLTIFEPFKQSQAGMNSKGGTGLGLAISRELARLMGGDILLQEKYEGNTFIFTIHTIAVSGEKALKQENTHSVIGIQSDEQEFKVLVVDDNQTNRELLKVLLEDIGFSIHEAVNGEEAVRIFEEWEPQIILMDIRMPVMNGLEASEKIRATAKGKEVVIIVVSATAMEYAEGSVYKDADAFLHKPVHLYKLLKTIEEHTKINYIYEEDLGLMIEPAPAAEDEASSPLSSELKAKLYNTAKIGNIGLLKEQIDAIEDIDLAIKKNLLHKIELFDIDGLISLLKPEKEGE